jgi:hypothetical protein
MNFADFRYPWLKDTGLREFRWLASFDTTVLIRNGGHVFNDTEECGLSCPALAIQQVTYGDVNRDRVDDAIVTLVYTT